MSSEANGRRHGGLGEDPIEVGRYLEALRRSRWLILTIVVVITGGVLAFSVTLPKTYQATASIVVDNASLRARAATEPTVAAQMSSLQARAAELEAASASAGSQLQLIQRPDVPSTPSSPRPLRNGVIALFASIFIGILVALAREQLTPRVTSQREISHLLGLTVLSGIPYVRRRVDAPYARAAYETNEP